MEDTAQNAQKEPSEVLRRIPAFMSAVKIQLLTAKSTNVPATPATVFSTEFATLVHQTTS